MNVEIKQIWEKYWQGNTSLEEEKRLSDFFLRNDIPEEWKKYRSLFVWKERQKVISVDTKVLKMPPKSIFIHFYPALKMAASVLIMLTVGIGFYTHYQQEKMMDKVFSEMPPVHPEDTIKESKEVMATVSLRHLSPEKIISEEMLDSLESLQKKLKDSLKSIENQMDSLNQEEEISLN